MYGVKSTKQAAASKLYRADMFVKVKKAKTLVHSIYFFPLAVQICFGAMITLCVQVIDRRGSFPNQTGCLD
jgi:hypothetical protein